MTCANHPDRENAAFCQNCGKPLCQECTRVVGSAVFCEPCLAAKLAGTGTPPPAGRLLHLRRKRQQRKLHRLWRRPTPTVPGEPNPGLAALLGFIPGVGAMYNGQYAKGVVHLIVFAILVSLANENGIFGLFIAGWVCYQVIEAHHTARARRDGTPLPNPFGLNDLGERLGFGKAWPGATHPSDAAAQQNPASSTTPPPASAYTSPTPGYPPQRRQLEHPLGQLQLPPACPSVPPYGTPGYPVDPAMVPLTRNRFPAGAIWLIGLGCLFLIGNAGLFHAFPIHRHRSLLPHRPRRLALRPQDDRLRQPASPTTAPPATSSGSSAPFAAPSGSFSSASCSCSTPSASSPGAEAGRSSSSSPA